MTEFDYNGYAKTLHDKSRGNMVNGTKKEWDDLCFATRSKWRIKAYEMWKNGEI